MKIIIYTVLIALVIQGCIGADIVDDFVEARVKIDNPITSLKVNSSYLFQATYLNTIGSPESAMFHWKSSNENVLQIDNEGHAIGLKEGESTVIATANGVSDSLILMVSDTTIGMLGERNAELKTSSSYPLTGNALLKKTGNNLTLEFDASFKTTSALPGLYVYLSNNVNSIKNAYEVGSVAEFSGAQSYNINEDIELYQYNYVLFFCKPFLVPVGNGELKP